MGDQSEAKRFVELPGIRRLAPLRSYKAETRTAELVWSTGARVRRFDWWEGEPFFEELEVSEEAVDLTRLNGGASVLNTHNDRDLSMIVGVTERAWIDGKEGIASVRFSRRADVEPIVQDVADGIIRHVSVGYFITQIEQRGFDKETGYKIMVVTRWQPFEISLVAVGADAKASLRAQPTDEKSRCLVLLTESTRAVVDAATAVAAAAKTVLETTEQPQQDASRAAPEPASKDQQFQESEAAVAASSTAQPAITLGARAMDPKASAAAGNADNQPNVSALEAEKERRQAVLNLCKANKIDPRVEARWIEDGTPLTAISGEILNVLEERGRSKPAEASALGLSRKETQNYSVFRAIRALKYGASNPAFAQEAAFEIECSRAIAKQLNRELTSNILVPGEVLMRPVGRDAAQRAMSTIPGSKGGYMVDVENMGFIDILRNRSVAMSMGARNLSGLVGNVTFARQTGKASVTWQGGEGTSVTASDQALGQLSMTPKTAIVITDVSEQMLRQATPSAEQFIMADLAADIAIDGVDNAVINGTGGAQPLGIKNTTGISSGQDASSATYAKILAFVSTAGALNAIRGNPGFVTNTAGAAKLMQVQRFTSTDSPVWEGNMLDGELVKFRAMSSEQLGSGNLIFGSWNEVVIGDWGVLELAMDNGGTRFNQAQVGIRAMWMVDVLVRYPQAFVVSTSLS